jgi:hypothetical protein
MAGYSGTPLPQKLGIKPGCRLALLGAPAGFSLGELPAGVIAAADGALDVIVLFVDRKAELKRQFAAARKRLQKAGGLWVAWPKRASGVATDVTEDVVRQTALAAGLVDNKVCAIDATWSGLRCVFRLRDRPGSH